MSEVTRILDQIDRGDPSAADQLLPLVYNELHRLAAAKLHHEHGNPSLDATSLVHETYLRLVESGTQQSWDSRGHFFAAAAEAMRRILLNRVRDNARLKRGGNRQRVELSKLALATEARDEDLVALDEAIELLRERDSVSADLVKLRFFAGLSLQEAAQALGLTRRQADRCWAYARAWLFDRLQRG